MPLRPRLLRTLAGFAVVLGCWFSLPGLDASAAARTPIQASTLYRSVHQPRKHARRKKHHRSRRHATQRSGAAAQTAGKSSSQPKKAGAAATQPVGAGSVQPQQVNGAAAPAVGGNSPQPQQGNALSSPLAPPAPQLIFDDEFNGPAGSPPDPSKWRAVSGDWSGGDGELEYYTPRSSNVALDGAGHLAITAIRETHAAAGGKSYPYTSGRIQTKDLFATTYGSLQASIKLPAGQGLWPAFWALGSNIDTVGWPACGEIDMMESLGNDTSTIYGSIHGPATGNADGYGLTSSKRAAVSLAGGFHTYGVNWSPGQIQFTLDGIVYATRSALEMTSGRQWVLDKPFYLLLNLAVGGGWPGSPNASTAFPATMLVDWVRGYR
jgi:beta-glucanase (GH16 family)